MQDPVLHVENLRLSFTTDLGTLPVLHGLSYAVEKGKVLAVVGESGSGKTVQALSILNLLPPNARVDGLCVSPTSRYSRVSVCEKLLTTCCKFYSKGRLRVPFLQETTAYGGFFTQTYLFLLY